MEGIVYCICSVILGLPLFFADVYSCYNMTSNSFSINVWRWVFGLWWCRSFVVVNVCLILWHPNSWNVAIPKTPITFVLPFILANPRLLILKTALKESKFKPLIKYLCPKTSRHNKCRWRAAVDTSHSSVCSICLTPAALTPFWFPLTTLPSLVSLLTFPFHCSWSAFYLHIPFSAGDTHKLWLKNHSSFSLCITITDLSTTEKWKKKKPNPLYSNTEKPRT